MNWHLLLAVVLLVACTESDAPDDDLTSIHPPDIARIVPAGDALDGAHVPTLDPITMNDAEIAKSLPEGPRCDFRYTTAGAPVLAVRVEPAGAARSAIVKLNGHLVPLEPAPIDAGTTSDDRLLVAAEPIRIVVQPDPAAPWKTRQGVQRRQADMIFEVGEKLRAGYRGYLDCALEPPTQALGHKSG
jgi:hypothetical protein